MKTLKFFVFLILSQAEEIDDELSSLIKDLEFELNRSPRSEGGPYNSNSYEKAQTRRTPSATLHDVDEDGIPRDTQGNTSSTFTILSFSEVVLKPMNDTYIFFIHFIKFLKLIFRETQISCN